MTLWQLYTRLAVYCITVYQKQPRQLSARDFGRTGAVFSTGCYSYSSFRLIAGPRQRIKARPVSRKICPFRN
jgi:hypothetical protein